MSVHTILLTLLAAASSQVILIAGKADDETTVACIAVTIIIGAVAAGLDVHNQGTHQQPQEREEFHSPLGRQKPSESVHQELCSLQGALLSTWTRITIMAWPKPAKAAVLPAAKKARFSLWIRNTKTSRPTQPGAPANSMNS